LVLERLRKKAYETVASSSNNTPPNDKPRSIASEDLFGVTVFVSDSSVTTEVFGTIALLDEIVEVEI